jgi:hypothetical protein
MRKLALLTGVFTALNLVKPVSNLIVSIRHIPATTVWINMATIGMTMFVTAVTGVGLLFYFALYCDQGTLHISRHVRLLGGVAALVQGIIMAADLPARLGALSSDWAVTRKLDWWNGAPGRWNAVRNPFTIACISNVLDLLLSVFSIALLIALSRDPSDKPSEEIPVGRVLREVSAVAVILFGLVLVGQLVGIGLAPHNYSVLRDYAYRLGRRPPRLAEFLTPLIRGLVLEACLFVAPFLVYRASLR